MKTNALLFLLLVLIMGSCSKSNTSPNVTNNTIVSSDSSDFNGRLVVTTYDFMSNTRLYGTDVFLYTNYDDIKHNLYLLTLRSNTSNAEADFGYLLQGNYYVRSQNAAKSDTALVQVLGRRINNKNVLLK